MAIFPIPFHFMHSLRFITSILFEKYYFLSVFNDEDNEDDKKIMKGKSEIVKCFR